MTVWPNGLKTKPDISTPWMGYPGHYGTDCINFDYNCAPEAGRVVYAGWNPSGAGNEIRIQADDGDIYRMLHNASLLVEFGDYVTEGQAVGIQGSTGDSSGKHCHFEVWPQGNINNRMDPEVFMAHVMPAGSGSSPFPNSPEEDEMPRYLFTDQDGEGFALIDSSYRDGVIVAPRGPVADAMSWVTKGGAPEKLTRKGFNAACASATALWRASGPTPTVVDPVLIRQIILKAFEDVTIPTPTISATDRQAIIDGAAAAVDRMLKDDFAAIPKPPTQFVAK